MMEVLSKHETLVSFKDALQVEKEGEIDQAASMYDKLLKKNPLNLDVLSRLMIVSRKLKNYRKEIIYIDTAIKIYEVKYARLKTSNSKVALLSKKLNASLGHTDKRGKNLLAIPEVEKLKKRKAGVLKKIT